MSENVVKALGWCLHGDLLVLPDSEYLTLMCFVQARTNTSHQVGAFGPVIQ